MQLVILECGACGKHVEGKANTEPNGNWFDKDYRPYAVEALRAHMHREHPDPEGEYLTLRFAERLAAEGMKGYYAGAHTRKYLEILAELGVYL